MKNYYLISGFLILLYACGSKQQTTSEKQKDSTAVPGYIKVSKDYIEIDVPTKRSPLRHSVSIDSVLIPLPGFDTKGQALLSIEKSNLLIATSKSDQAYVLDLDSMKVVKEYRMRQALDLNRSSKEEPCDCAMDLSVDLEGLDFYTNNNIILQVNWKLLIINPSGKIVDSIPLRDPNDPPKFIYENINNVPVDYNPLTNKIYVYKYCYCKGGSIEYYSYPFEVGIDATDKKMTDENVKYPEIYSLFGLRAMETVWRTSYENFQYFTFFPDHRTYVYNTLNREIVVHGGQSMHSSGKIPVTSKLETDFDKMLEKSQGTDLYFQLVYDDINNRYYRLFMHPVKYDPDLGRIKFDSYVQIFDHNFNLQDEVKFDRFSAFYFSYGGKLYSTARRKEGVMFFIHTFK